MAIVLPPGYGIATMRWTLQGVTNPFSCTMGFFSELADPALAAEQFYQACVTPTTTTPTDRGPCHPAEMVQGWRFQGIETIMGSEGGITGSSFGGTVIGTAADRGGPVSPIMCIVVKKKTAFVGKQQRGRMFTPPISLGAGADSVGGQWSASQLAFAESRWPNFLAELISSTTKPFLLHSINKLGVTLPPTAITSLEISSHIGVQRLRFD